MISLFKNNIYILDILIKTFFSFFFQAEMLTVRFIFSNSNICIFNLVKQFSYISVIVNLVLIIVINLERSKNV